MSEVKVLSFHEKLVRLQTEISVPKNKFNEFGKYKYRACEDILEAMKPYLLELKLFVTLSDEIQLIGTRFYVVSTARITDGVSFVENKAMAREPEIKKGMDESQITGAASSYARKYSLAGILGLDDERDSDAPSNKPKVEKDKTTPPVGKTVKEGLEIVNDAINEITRELSRITLGLDKNEKAQFMKKEVGVNSFFEIQKLPLPKLKEIITKLSAMPSKEAVNV